MLYEASQARLKPTKAWTQYVNVRALPGHQSLQLHPCIVLKLKLLARIV